VTEKPLKKILIAITKYFWLPRQKKWYFPINKMTTKCTKCYQLNQGRPTRGPISYWHSVIFLYFECFSTVFVLILPKTSILLETFPNSAQRSIWVGHPRAKLKQRFFFAVCSPAGCRCHIVLMIFWHVL
jgi:hypothetical protein